MGSKLGCALAGALALAAGASAAPSRTSAGTIVFAANRAPTLYGEVYAVGLDGTRVDLSRSQALDVNPVVSPDSTRVAFASNRSGRLALYTVRLDGTHLRRVTPLLFSGEDARGASAEIAWSPDSTKLAATLGGYGGALGFWIGDVRGRGRVVSRTHSAGAPAWSPDGRVLAYTLDGSSETDVASSTGKVLWRVLADPRSQAWSAAGRLAVTYHGAVRVYDEQGHRLASLPGTAFAWSPDGKELAALQANGRLRVVGGAGTGRRIVDARLDARYGQIQWIGNAKLRVATGNGWLGFDVGHDRRWQLPAAYAAFSYPAVISPSGQLAYSTASLNAEVDLKLGVSGKTLATATGCHDDVPFSSLQFVPNGRALVYQSGCILPSADLYAIAGDGTGLTQLTRTPVDETSPAWSPDGTRVAYQVQAVAAKCDGCARSLWVMNADGSSPRALTKEDDLNYDETPSWSPDGATVAYEYSTPSTSSLSLVTVATGAVRRLGIVGRWPVFASGRIAYAGGNGISSVLPDGSQPIVLARSASAYGLSASRDGRLAYMATGSQGRLSIAIVGGTKIVLDPILRGTNLGTGTGPAWSPDGTKLAFTAQDAQGVSDVWVVNADGSHLTRLTRGLGAVGGLSWKP